MKRSLLAFGFAFAAVCAVQELDNTVSDDFWDTTGYVNATTSTASGAMAAAFDSRIEAAFASETIGHFNTRPFGAFMVIR